MQQFNLDTWLQDKSRKVVTRDGRPVRILCTDAKGKLPIIALVPFGDSEDAYHYNKNGVANGFESITLFFADEEEELTEFEEAIYQNICTIVAACDGEVYGDKELKPIVKGIAKDILALARKEILKDLPKWKDVSGRNGAGTKDYEIVGYYLVKGNYAIYLKNLDKLPKEE